MDLIESLRPYHGAALAFAVAIAAVLAARALRRPLPGGVAAGIGALAGWWFAFGLLTASPRQLPERLPLLLLVLVLAVPLLAALARRWRWLALPGALLGAGWVGWWMAGAPLTMPDLRRAGMVLVAVAGATLLLALRGGPRWAGPVAAAALLGGLAAAALPGPYVVLGAALFAAAAGVAALGPRGGGAAPMLDALPLAGALAALAAIPVIARGAPADWAAAAAPLAALALGAPAGARLGGRFGALFGAVLAGAACATVAFLIA
ncbi:hypothetical protein [Falsiroseomonas sp.]|uniref:hypothetical protein n=1 Tax=Falsiroseomonas sp. TaxID=2870721 RepID=UPI00356837DD